MGTENENEKPFEIDVHLVWHLHQSGFVQIVYIPGRGYCGLQYMICNDWDLCYGLTWDSIEGRYCYSSMLDAFAGLFEWSGVGHAPGDWVTHKCGRLKEKNPNREKHV